MLSAQTFRGLPLEEQLEKTQTDYSNWELWTEENLRVKNEDLSNKMKVAKLKELQKKTINCADVSFKILGISLATLNTIISLILSVIIFKTYLNYEKNK